MVAVHASKVQSEAGKIRYGRFTC